MENYKITYHEIMDDENIYTINFPKLNDLMFAQQPVLPVEQNEICTTINPLQGEKIKTDKLENLLKTTKTLKYIANKAVFRIRVNGDGFNENGTIENNSLNAENFKVLINFLKDLNCKAIYIENLTCSGAHKLSNNGEGKDILDIVNETGLKQDVYYGHVTTEDEYAAEPSIIEYYEFDEKEKKLTLRKNYNICNNEDINPIFNDQQLEEFSKDLQNNIKLASYKETWTEFADMSKEQQIQYMELMECISNKNNGTNQDTTTEAIELLDLIGKNVKNNTPIYTSESKPKEKSK